MQKRALLVLFGLALGAQSPEPALPVTPAPSPAIATNDPAIAGPLACVKKNLPRFKVQSIDFASRRSAPVPTVVLRCHVLQNQIVEVWEFSLTQKPNKAWRLQAATCLGE